MISFQEIQFSSKNHEKCLIRYPRISDVEELTGFINFFSKEDLFTRFSGEQMSFEEEQNYLQSEIDEIEAGDNVKLFCFVDGRLAGLCDIHRDKSLLSRKLHGGILGMIIGKEFRREGIGERLIKETMNQACEHIAGIKLIKLECFATNNAAFSLYKKVGFKEVGRIPKSLFYKNEYVDEVIMTKELVPF